MNIHQQHLEHRINALSLSCPSKDDTEMLIMEYDIEPLDLMDIRKRTQEFIQYYAMTFAETMTEKELDQFLRTLAWTFAETASKVATRHRHEANPESFKTGDQAKTPPFNLAVTAVLAGALRVAAESATAQAQTWL